MIDHTNISAYIIDNSLIEILIKLLQSSLLNPHYESKCMMINKTIISSNINLNIYHFYHNKNELIKKVCGEQKKYLDIKIQKYENNN